MTELRIERMLPAAPDRVWRAFTEELPAWFWPDSFATTVDLDLRPGGRYRIASSVAGMAVGGEFTAVDAPHTLVQTWLWDGDVDGTLVTVTLEPADGATRLTVDHEGFADDVERDNHIQGWNDCLDRLGPYLAA